jgi:hypothetical protein
LANCGCCAKCQRRQRVPRQELPMPPNLVWIFRIVWNLKFVKYIWFWKRCNSTRNFEKRRVQKFCID